MSNDNNIERALGRVEGSLRQVLENQTRAEISRKQLYEAVEAVRGENADYRRRLEGLEKRMDAVEKPVADLNKWRERSIGIIMTISTITALLGGAFAASWAKILELFR